MKLAAYIPPRLATYNEQKRQRALATARLRASIAAGASAARPGDIEVSLSDRYYVIGDTGSGKSRFARELTRELHRMYPGASVYALDSKGGDDFTGWPGLVDTDDPPPPIRPGRIQVWQPADDVPSAYEAWLQGILKARRPAVVFIDELSSLARGQSAQSYPLALTRLQKQGRGLGISVITLTQEATFIPRQVKTLATHVIAFRLGDDEHARANVARLLGHAEYQLPRAPFGFHYRRLQPRLGATVEYTDYREFIGR